MKILVLGGTGMAGHTISMYLSKVGYDVTALSRSKINYCKNINCNITDFENLKKILEFGEYDVIINAIGVLNQYADNDKLSAILLNSYLPHFLSYNTKNLKTKIIQLSTDCVFSGKIGRYSEYSFRDGDKFYDRSKALGELDNDKDLTFRTSIIGPDIKKSGIGLFNWFMKQDGEIKGFKSVIWSGVTTLILSKAIDEAIKDNLVGIYNLVNNDTISKYELLMLFNKHFKNNSIRIIEDYKIKLDKSLINNRKDFSFKVPTYEKMILEMKESVYKNKDLYPHYFL